MAFLFIRILVVWVMVSPVYAQEAPVLKGQKEKVSYIIGLDIGKNFRQQSIDINPDILSRGIRDGLSGAKSLLTDQEAREIMTSFEKEMRGKQEERKKQVGEKNQREGEVFLAENKNKEGIRTLPSGLQYKVIKPGTGKKPKLADSVTAHYRGTMIDGTEFDSSYRRGRPASFPVSGVIPGWTEVLQIMEEGAKWQVFIPPNLAYGEQGAGQVIGPHATLIFEVELISVQEKK